jgi:hypothetical protein
VLRPPGSCRRSSQAICRSVSQITSPRLGIQAGHAWLHRASAFRQFVLQAISLVRIGDLPSPLPMANPEVFEIL